MQGAGTGLGEARVEHHDGGVLSPRERAAGATKEQTPSEAFGHAAKSAGTPTPPVQEWVPRTRPGLNGLPPSPCDGQDAPLPGRCALGGLTIESTGTSV